MLTTKAKIAELTLRRLRKYSVDSDVDERELMIAIHHALGILVRNRLFESKGVESQEIDGTLYYSIHGNKVLKNELGQYYTKLPSTTISLPFGAEIKRIGAGRGRGYIPVANGFEDLYAGMLSSLLESNVGYYKEGSDIMFSNMTANNSPDKVSITMVLPFDNFDEDDEINIPADMLDLIVDSVFQKYGGTLQMPADETNNSIDQ